jgi:hypothetical protein
MRRSLIGLALTLIVFSTVTLSNPKSCQALGTVEPGGFCETNPDNCQTPAKDPANGQDTNFHCVAQIDPLGGVTVNTCQPDQNAAPPPPGGQGQKQCPAKGEKCDLVGTGNTAQNGGCCEHDVDGTTPLGCDKKTNTCQPQAQIQCDPKTDPTCNACANENQPCGKDTNLNCCNQVKDKSTLTCVDATNQPVALSLNGSCKFIDKSTITPTLPPVPPPPCANGQMGPDGVCTSFMTAFGTINTDVQGFVLKLFGFLLAVSGAIAVLLLIRAGYILMTSAGNPERVKTAREQLVAAIVGLLFIIFSVAILETITTDILHIPGFTVGP